MRSTWHPRAQDLDLNISASVSVCRRTEKEGSNGPTSTTLLQNFFISLSLSMRCIRVSLFRRTEKEESNGSTSTTVTELWVSLSVAIEI
ncbi:hypothetical protein J6590_025912 [Homalodisca vitripennis]|nr:hypothetical protein J6590_025912 [Homalodisca vitripennis]